MWEKKETLKERFTKERISEAVQLLQWGYKKLNPHYRRVIFVHALINIIPSFINLYTTWITKELVNSAVNHESSIFSRYAALFIFLTIFNFVYGLLSNYYDVKQKSGMAKFMRQKFYRIMLDKEYGVMEKIRVGELYQRLQVDVPSICNQLYTLPSFFLDLAIQIGGSAIMIFKIVPEAGMIALPLTFIMSFLTYYISSKMRKHSRILWQKNTVVNSVAIEHLNNLMIFHTFGRENASYDQLSDAMEDARNTELEVTRLSMFYNSITSILMMVISVGSMFYLLSKIMNNHLSFGTYTMLLALVEKLKSQMGNISNIIPTLYNLMISSERAYEIDICPNDLTRDAISEEAALEFYNKEFKAIELKNITFSYPSSNRNIVLENFNMTINKGEYVAITGLSGCGKSTSQKLMLGLYRPDKGNLYLIKKKGKEVLDSSWRALFSYVPQRNLLFYGTIREAIAFGEPDDDEEKYWQALRIACADDFVRELPDGLDTQLGENGTGFSEGQIQRLAIARAIYSQRPILLLDECTSSLDVKTEKQLLKNLRSMTDVTLVIVTHRPAALKYCDRVISFTNKEEK